MNILAGNLEFLLSSLPYLHFSNSLEFKNRVKTIFHAYAKENQSLSLPQILDLETAKYVSEKDYELFSELNLKNCHSIKFQKSNYPVLAQFAQFSFALKTELQTLRNNEKETQLTKNSFEFIEQISGNPLEKEIQLITLQWQELERLSIGFYADFNQLIAYKLQLLLLLKWWTYNETVGFENYQKLIND